MLFIIMPIEKKMTWGLHVTYFDQFYFDIAPNLNEMLGIFLCAKYLRVGRKKINVLVKFR